MKMRGCSRQCGIRFRSSATWSWWPAIRYLWAVTLRTRWRLRIGTWSPTSRCQDRWRASCSTFSWACKRPRRTRRHCCCSAGGKPGWWLARAARAPATGAWRTLCSGLTTPRCPHSWPGRGGNTLRACYQHVSPGGPGQAPREAHGDHWHRWLRLRCYGGGTGEGQDRPGGGGARLVRERGVQLVSLPPTHGPLPRYLHRRELRLQAMALHRAAPSSVALSRRALLLCRHAGALAQGGGGGRGCNIGEVQE
mmetsp:Transcript_2435/g.6130  ORF Transcript_2435/g.6130 Transcript_2435/m.6130 type:complete len:251 (-) Transcript_2435:1874-2626(-)